MQAIVFSCTNEEGRRIFFGFPLRSRISSFQKCRFHGRLYGWKIYQLLCLARAFPIWTAWALHSMSMPPTRNSLFSIWWINFIEYNGIWAPNILSYSSHREIVDVSLSLYIFHHPCAWVADAIRCKTRYLSDTHYSVFGSNDSPMPLTTVLQSVEEDEEIKRSNRIRMMFYVILQDERGRVEGRSAEANVLAVNNSLNRLQFFQCMSFTCHWRLLTHLSWDVMKAFTSHLLSDDKKGRVQKAKDGVVFVFFLLVSIGHSFFCWCWITQLLLNMAFISYPFMDYGLLVFPMQKFSSTLHNSLYLHYIYSIFALHFLQWPVFRFITSLRILQWNFLVSGCFFVVRNHFFCSLHRLLSSLAFTKLYIPHVYDLLMPRSVCSFFIPIFPFRITKEGARLDSKCALMLRAFQISKMPW